MYNINENIWHIVALIIHNIYAERQTNTSFLNLTADHCFSSQRDDDHDYNKGVKRCTCTIRYVRVCSVNKLIGIGFWEVIAIFVHTYHMHHIHNTASKQCYYYAIPPFDVVFVCERNVCICTKINKYNNVLVYY